jgi:hypothetical protein
MIFPLRDCITAAVALDKPRSRHYNAASSEGKPSGPDVKPVNGAATEHQAKKFCYGNRQVCPSGNEMKLLECLLSRL